MRCQDIHDKAMRGGAAVTLKSGGAFLTFCLGTCENPSKGLVASARTKRSTMLQQIKVCCSSSFLMLFLLFILQFSIWITRTFFCSPMRSELTSFYCAGFLCSSGCCWADDKFSSHQWRTRQASAPPKYLVFRGITHIQMHADAEHTKETSKY